MRAVTILAGLSVLLCACEKEPNFDERYARTEKEIGQRATEIDQDLAGTKQSGEAASSSADKSRPSDF